MNRLFILAMAALMLAGCGIKKPLIRPSAIPAYEEKRARKRQQLEQENQTPADATTTETPTESTPK